MSPRSSVAPVVASGTASAVKLLVATLAFAGAYFGVEATYGAPAPAPAVATAQAPARTVELSSRAMPAAEQVRTGTERVSTGAEQARGAVERVSAAGEVPAAGEVGAAGKVLLPGTVTVSALDALGPCDKPYQAESVIGNDDPRATVSYGWRLERWSPGTRRWQAYLGTGSGFGGESQAVEWQPRIVNNPGWYRVVLSVPGDAPLRSEKFLVSC
ncbi:hypothetical protein [Streptosporangium sp. NPDC048865]|uniref:hypothetical protein n=1 Tax=Streptosporangium sp. NPDC048865 TaxID=3155766 RepID=UPI00343E5CF3